jgi:hypothetical protein
MFRVTFQHQHFYFLTQEMKQVMLISLLDQVWKERVLEFASNVLLIPSSRARPAALSIRVTDTTAEYANGDPARQIIEEQGPSPSMRQTTDVPLCSSNRRNMTSHWASPEARSLFCPRRQGAGGSVSGRCLGMQ